MRRKSTFVLTILPAETSENELHGSLRTVADGSQATFSNLDELYALIQKAVTSQEEKETPRLPLMKAKPVRAS